MTLLQRLGLESVDDHLELTRHRIAVIDGPNMSNLGRRDSRVYGSIPSLDELRGRVQRLADRLDVDVEFFTSNYEGALLEYIHDVADRVDAVIINPAGLTEVGEATRHALEDTGLPVVECHFANIVHRNLPSRFTRTATGMSMGMRQYSYDAALVGLVQSLDDPSFLGSG